MHRLVSDDQLKKLRETISEIDTRAKLEELDNAWAGHFPKAHSRILSFKRPYLTSVADYLTNLSADELQKKDLVDTFRDSVERLRKLNAIADPEQIGADPMWTIDATSLNGDLEKLLSQYPDPRPF